MLIDTAKKFVKDTRQMVMFVDPRISTYIKEEYEQVQSIVDFGPICRLLLGRGELKEATSIEELPKFIVYHYDTQLYYSIRVPRIRILRKSMLYSLKLDLKAQIKAGGTLLSNTSVYSYPFYKEAAVENEFRFDNWLQPTDPNSVNGVWTGALYTYTQSAFSNADAQKIVGVPLLTEQTFYPARDTRYINDGGTAKFCKGLYTWLDKTLAVYKAWIIEDFKDQVEQCSAIKVVSRLFNKEQQSKYFGKKVGSSIWR